ncbi:MAG: hypothetical protein VX589_03255 [Myxococcota bacterium]|nr:hypothetical protein [Myxococcota bacterium]
MKPYCAIAISFCLSACSWWLDDVPDECAEAADCFEGERCVEGRCALDRNQDDLDDFGGALDQFVADDFDHASRTPDAMLDPDQRAAAERDDGPDAAERALDSDAAERALDSDAAERGVAPDAAPPFPDGACFPDDMLPELKGGWLDPPLPFCTAWARGWIAREADHNVFTYRSGHAANSDTMRMPMVMWQRPAFSGTNAYVAVLNEKDTEAVNIYRHSLTMKTTDIDTNWFISRSPLQQTHPVRGDGFTAFLEETADDRQRVYVQLDPRRAEDTRRGFPCERNGNLDNQTDLASGGPWIAWLERSQSDTCAHVVMSRAEDCKNYFNQARWDLSGQLVRASNEHAALHMTQGALIWLEDNQPCRASAPVEEGIVTHIKVWPFSLRNRPNTLRLEPPMDGQPLDVASHPSHNYIVVLAWLRGPRQLYLVDVQNGTSTRIETQGMLAHPHIGDRYIVWSEQSTTDGTWEIRYEQLP